jgi:hypothetical protein
MILNEFLCSLCAKLLLGLRQIKLNLLFESLADYVTTPARLDHYCGSVLNHHLVQFFLGQKAPDLGLNLGCSRTASSEFLQLDPCLFLLDQKISCLFPDSLQDNHSTPAS